VGGIGPDRGPEGPRTGEAEQLAAAGEGGDGDLEEGAEGPGTGVGQ